MVPGKIIVIAAPSGSGKTTLVQRLLHRCELLEFSISACTRKPRPNEAHGRDYYFLSETEFRSLIEDQAFIEWEMVYPGKYYGTLKSELERISNSGKLPIVDIDVRGALSIKEKYQDACITIFIKAPSIEVLRARLINRGTETGESLEERVHKAELEFAYATYFDYIVVNNDLDIATRELSGLLSELGAGCDI